MRAPFSVLPAPPMRIGRQASRWDRLHGVPIALKDNINTAAFPTTAGTPALRRHRPKANAPVAQALIDAGAIVFGKTGLHELAFGITSNNPGFGAIHNPFDPKHVPGGSSGGSGAVVGARVVPASIGTDTGGSVRVPAAFCGVQGFRPTVRRWPQAGIVPISSTRDTAGPLARNAADLAAIDAAVTSEKGRSLAQAAQGSADRRAAVLFLGGSGTGNGADL